MKSIKLKLLIFIGMILIVCSTILLYRTYTFKEEEKRQIEMIQHTVENLLKTSEKTFMRYPDNRAKEDT